MRPSGSHLGRPGQLIKLAAKLINGPGSLRVLCGWPRAAAPTSLCLSSQIDRPLGLILGPRARDASAERYIRPRRPKLAARYINLAGAFEIMPEERSHHLIGPRRAPEVEVASRQDGAGEGANKRHSTRLDSIRPDWTRLDPTGPDLPRPPHTNELEQLLGRLGTSGPHLGELLFFAPPAGPIEGAGADQIRAERPLVCSGPPQVSPGAGYSCDE